MWPIAPEHHNACDHHLTLHYRKWPPQQVIVSVILVMVYLSAGGATFATKLFIIVLIVVCIYECLCVCGGSVLLCMHIAYVVD